MAEDDKPKQLQAMFDVDDYGEETIEGVGFESGTLYHFTIDKQPQGRYMQYGSKRDDGRNGLYVLTKGVDNALMEDYYKHPDKYEIFTSGELNGQQALIPGKDFDQFKPLLTRTISIGFKCTENNRLVFMQMGTDSPKVNPSHPEWESQIVRLSRKLGYEPPAPGSNEKFMISPWLHPGVSIAAEVVMTKRKGMDREVPEIDIDTIELAEAGAAAKEDKAQTTLAKGDLGIDPEIKMTIESLAKGCKTPLAVIKAVKTHLKNEGIDDPSILGQYNAAIDKMQKAKLILQ